MAFYELVFITRQDVSSSDVDRIVEEFGDIAKENGAEILKNEYWGLRSLAYSIKGNSKGHYVMFGLESGNQALKEIERKMKINEDILRFLTIKVENIDSEPSPILKEKNNYSSPKDQIDVTVSPYKENVNVQKSE